MKKKVPLFCKDSNILSDPTIQRICGTRSIDKIYQANAFEIMDLRKNIESLNFLDSFATINAWGDYYGVIYLFIDNNLDGTLPYKMYYSGQTIQNLYRRFYCHLNYPANLYLEMAVKRYGKLNIIHIDENTFQTDNGEFTIRVLKKCRDLDELNKEEINYISKYKSSILDYYYYDKSGIRRPLYGYNVTRGGGGYPSISGDIHSSFKHVDKSLLKELILEGFTAEEIARELEISLPTLISKVIYFWGSQGITSITEARKAFGGNEAYLNRVGKAGKSVTGVEIDGNLLIQSIREGLFMNELIMFFEVSHDSITKKLNELGYHNLTDAREKLGVMLIFTQRWLNEKDRRTLRGEEHQDYVLINPIELKAKITEGLSAENVAQFFKVSRPTILSRLKDFWSFRNFKQAQIFFLIHPIINRIIGRRLNDEFNELSNEELELEYLKALIYFGYNQGQLSRIYRFGREGIRKYLLLILKKDIEEAMLEYYWKPKIISYIMRDLSMRKLEDELHISSHFVYLEKIWSNIYSQFNQRNHDTFRFLKRFYNYYPKINNDLLSDLHNKGLIGRTLDNYFRQILNSVNLDNHNYHKYVKRLATVYIKINRDLAFSLLSQNYTPNQIDREFVIFLVKNTSNMKEIAYILGMGLVQARQFLRNIPKFDYNEARGQL